MWTLLRIFVLATSILKVESIVHTNGSSGEPCPVKKCLEGRADCIDGSCKCRPPFELDQDNGNFACYRNNNVFGEVKNDPNVRNFNDEVANFPYPCRYLLSSTTTNLRIHKQTVGFCTCQLHAWNQKSRGKFFLGGFDFACLINNTATHENLGFSIRQEGVAQNGHYTYIEYGAEDYLPNGPWTTTPVDVTGAGVTVRSHYDTINNQAIINILECGWVVTLLAYDVLLTRDQDQIPGLAFGVNCGLNPFFYEHDRVIATAPVKFGGTKYSDLADPPLSASDVLLIRGFTSNVVQNQPLVARQCNTVGSYLDKCTEENLKRAGEGCFWMLDEPRFIRCLGSSADAAPILDLLQTCITYYCTSAVTCNSFVNSVTGTTCAYLRDIPGLQRITDPSFCG